MALPGYEGDEGHEEDEGYEGEETICLEVKETNFIQCCNKHLKWVNQ